MNLVSNHSTVGSGSGNLKVAGYLAAAAITLFAIVLQMNSAFGDSLQWHRDESLSSRMIDWATGHLTHWSWDHLIWDALAFVALAFTALQLLPSRFILCLVLSAFVITLEIWLNQPHLETYRGLSGIDSALFGLVIAGLWKTGNRWGRPVALIAGGMFVAKTAFEIVTGENLFVTAPTGDQSFVPVASAHVTGFASGVFAGLVKIKIPKP